MNTAIITGASSGLGREMAKRIKDMFPDVDRVWLIARRRERLEDLAKEQGDFCRVMPLDITDANDIDKYRAALAESDNRVALLINNAGYGILGEFEGSDVEEQAGMVDLNVRALTVLTQITLDYMPKGARIINISSIASFVPNARMAVYSATKYYVRAFSRALGFELKRREISVTAVCPGPMSTEFLDVARIGDNSKTFNILPRVPVAKAAEGVLRAALRRKSVYTPGAFYKFYRVISAIIPDTILMYLAKA